MNTKALFVFAVVCFCAIIKANAQFGIIPNQLIARKYTIGDKYRYKLTLKEYHDDKLAFTSISVCELKVITDEKGIPYDEICWLSKKTTRGSATVDDGDKASLVKPYRISLDSRGSVNLPKIEVWQMTEPIEDFNTFFIAVGSMFPGMDELTSKGDSLTMGFPIVADFSNGVSILKGQDAFFMRFKVEGITGVNFILKTAFLPPAKPGFAYLTADMNTQVVAGTFNNFQMVAPAGNGLYDVQYGREYFTITNTIRKSDGKIVKGEMFNRLNTQLMSSCDKDYKNPASVRPYSERRILTLELL
jgi:hypothetical protein